jgi:hypothetical protein
MVFAAVSPPRMTMARGLVLAVAAGCAVGVATSFGQAHLDGVLNAFVNSASAWLVAPFAVGFAVRGRGTPFAAGIGLLTCVLQVVAYYATAELRGFPASHAEIAFWAICALAGGPVFGAAGSRWRVDGAGGATLGAAFIAEGLWTYAHRLDRPATAVVWCAIGVAALLSERRRAVLPWLGVLLPAALAAEVALSAVRG